MSSFVIIDLYIQQMTVKVMVYKKPRKTHLFCFSAVYAFYCSL